MDGKVWLVGAGPGDLGLFTLKGRNVLNNADVVIYDSLVGDSVLSLIPEHAKKINVGKRASRHTMRQEDINHVIAEEALKGQRVVRLKGGDPLLFGRGGEELELLCEKNIPYEIVPGVPSPIAVPAYNGIPVTHRDYVSSLHIITGHRRAGREYDIDFRALVDTRGTLVFLMGISSLEDICSNLIEAGMPVDMPAAVLQQGTTARQKRIVATVSTLAKRVQQEGVETPAIIVVGEVCSLADGFEWYEKLPLAGKKVIVTRPKELSSRMAHQLRLKGAEVLELPAISTERIADNTKLKECFMHIENYTWIVFTSPTGVNVFFRELLDANLDVRKMAGMKIASIGEGTRRELRKYGFNPDMIPSVYDGETLGRELAVKLQSGDKVLIPRASIGNQILVDELMSVDGVQVDDVPTYDTLYMKHDVIDEAELFEKGRIDCAVFTSASTVKAFARTIPELDYSLVTAACIGRQTRAAADELGMKTYVAKKATIEDVVNLVTEIL